MTVDSSVVVASGKLVPGGKEVVGNELSSWPSHSVTPCVGKSEFNTSYSSISSESDQVLQTNLSCGCTSVSLFIISSCKVEWEDF